MPETMIENNTDKCIDFNAQIQAIKKQTETDLPYTLTQVEDAMYIDDRYLVTLEYIYYQCKCHYANLTPQIEYIDK